LGEPLSSDGTTSESRAGDHGSAKARTLRRCQGQRARRFLVAIEEARTTGVSFLENQSVGRATLAVYAQAVADFLAWLPTVGGSGSDDFSVATTTDGWIVQFLEKMFMDGHPVHRGEKFLAGFCFRYAQYSRFGSCHLPRSWRCLKGWRKISPGRSRLPETLGFRIAVATLMVIERQPAMGVFVLMSVSTYLRPGQLIPLLKKNLVPPATRVTEFWTVLANAIETGTVSKTGDTDVSIQLDSRWLRWANPLWAALAAGNPSDRVFTFSYPQMYTVFRKVVKFLGRPDTVPYQTRHSGPSIDVAASERSLAETQKRGQWKSIKSVRRYEKSGRLAAMSHRLSCDVQAYMRECEKRCEGVFLFGREPPLPPFPRDL